MSEVGIQIAPSLEVACRGLARVPASRDVRTVKYADTGRSPNWAVRDRPISGLAGVSTTEGVNAEGGRGDGEDGNVSIELIDRARSGDEAAFEQLVGPYRHEMQVHCYRILGSVADAEDALQETLTAAWQGLAGFEGRASIRTWLYRIATTRCLNMLRSASRRPPVDRAGARRSSRPNRPGWARSSGSSPTPTSCSPTCRTARPAPRPATRPARPSHWPS